jgi:hypothetical protein
VGDAVQAPTHPAPLFSARHLRKDNAVMYNMNQPRTPLATMLLTQSLTAVGAILVVLSPGIAAAQLPPGGRVVRIDTGYTDGLPWINDHRQIAFVAVTETGLDIFLYDGFADTVTRLTANEMAESAPMINNDGWVLFHRGMDNNTSADIALWRDGTIEMLTDTPDALESGPVANESGLAVWHVKPCCPVQDRAEVIRYRFDRDEADQLTFGYPMGSNQTPNLNNDGLVWWLNLDWTFGLWDLFRKGMLYDNGRISSPPTRNRSGIASVTERGQMMWTSNWKTFLTDDDETRKILDFGSTGGGMNINGDIGFPTLTTLNWLMRNGVYYQTFFHISINGLRINNRGESVGRGVGADSGDVFAMFIDPIPGDHDEDGDVDRSDLRGFIGCLEGPGERLGPPELNCEPMDFDDDGDVDLGDFASYQLAHTGECAVGITTPPIWKGVCAGDPVEFHVDVRGPAASYQWRKYQDDIEGATGPDFRIDSVRLSDDGYYGVRIMTECGWEVFSDERFRIRATSFTPSYREQPESQTVCPGEDVRFCGQVDGPEYLHDTYQWEKDGEQMDPEEDWWCHIIRDVRASDAGEYRLAATNACGTTYSDVAVLTVETPTGPPLITVHPHDEITMRQGGTAPFYIRATCAERYQWQKDDRDIPGATDRELNIYPVTCADAGQYTVVVSNEQGSVTTLPGSLTVPDCP